METPENKKTELVPLRPVYPNKQPSVFCLDDNDGYGGAHFYKTIDSSGWNPDTREFGYSKDKHEIQVFIFNQKVVEDCKCGKKKKKISIVPGLQNEQLIIILIDRLTKLNAKFPSTDNERAIASLEAALSALENRVAERVGREVMDKMEL